MHENPIPECSAGAGLSPAEEDDRVESAILALLLLSPQPPGLWSAEEIAREMGDPLAVTDALARLARAGLIHRLEGFVFATRAAARADQLQM